MVPQQLAQFGATAKWLESHWGRTEHWGWTDPQSRREGVHQPIQAVACGWVELDVWHFVGWPNVTTCPWRFFFLGGGGVVWPRVGTWLDTTFDCGAFRRGVLKVCPRDPHCTCGGMVNGVHPESQLANASCSGFRTLECFCVQDRPVAQILCLTLVHRFASLLLLPAHAHLRCSLRHDR